jgi:hypothetical protein
MAVEKTKHAFVDDNPYLVYSGEPDTSVDNAGGDDGGNESNILFVGVNEDITTWTSDGIILNISENKSTIVNAMQTGKIVLFVVRQTMAGDNFIRHYIRANVVTQNNEAVIATYTNIMGNIAYYQITVEDDEVSGRLIDNA